MKKIFAVIVILLAVAAGFAPFVNGLIMEKIARQNQNDLNKIYADTGSGVSIEILDYHRSFASSEIEWKINLGSLAPVYGINEILLVDRAEHGYTGVMSRTSLERNLWYTDVINNRLGGKDPLHIKNVYKLTGDVKSTIDLDAFSIQMANETIDFRPAKIVIDISKGFRHFESNTAWKGFSVSDKARMDGLTVKSGLEKISTYIWDGEIEYKIDSVQVDDQAAKFALSQFKGKYSLDFNKEKNTLSMGGEAAFKNLAGESDKIENGFIRLDINNLDAQGYEEFMEIYTRTVQSALDEIGRAQEDPQEMEQTLKGHMAGASLQLLAAYEKFLKKGLEIRVTDAHAKLSMGNINGDLELKLNRDVTFAQLAPIASRPNLAFDILSLRSSLRFPEELAGNDYVRLISPVHPAMQTGLFIVDGDYMVHTAETRDGKLFLNGLEVVFN